MTRKDPHAVALGRRGGKVTSEAKTRAVRRNALKGGRPRKFAVHDLVRAHENAPRAYAGRTGVIAKVGPGRSEYRVRFDAGMPQTGLLKSWWLDRI